MSHKRTGRIGRMALLAVFCAWIPGTSALGQVMGQPEPSPPAPAPAPLRQAQGPEETRGAAPAPAPAAGAPCPGPFVVAAKSKADGKPLPGVVIRLGARYSATDRNGEALFDGVPAGTHRLRIAQGGFHRLEQDVALPAGKRAPLQVSLEPERRVRLDGRVSTKDMGVPLAGARVVLTPASVPAGIQGILAFTTDWDGKFVALEVPVGTYRAEVRAEGCKPLVAEAAVGADGKVHEFALERVLENATLSVRVQDASGAPVPGAEVVLAEAYPRGEIRRAKAGADGTARFDDLRIAQVNSEDAKGNVPAPRRHVTLHAEAKGFAPATIPVALAPGASATASLLSLREIEEQEPNDSVATAQAIDVGATVRCRISKAGDRDAFRFRLPQPGRLRMAMDASPDLDTHVELFDPRGKSIARRGVYKGQPNGFDLPLSEGDYFLAVSEWGDDARSERPLSFRFDYTPMPDPLFPNGDPGTARSVRPNETMRGTFLAGDEADCYRFTLRRPSAVRVSLSAEPFERHVELRRAGGQPTGDFASAYGGHPAVLQASLPAGDYAIVATEWNRDHSPMANASIRFEAIEDDGWNDGPAGAGPLASARALPPDALVASTILPWRDADLYAVSLPSSGTLRVEESWAHEQSIRVLDRDGRVLAEGRAYGGGPVAVDAPVSQAQTVFVEMREWNDDDRFTPNPYVLRTLWFPCEEAEAAGRNDGPDTPSPFEAGDVLRGTFAPIGDVDVWRFDADRPGRLELDVDTPGEISIRVLDGRGQALASWNAYGGRGALWASVPPGAVLVEVREWGDNAWNPGAYAIRTRFSRADPGERMPLRDDPGRALTLGEARPFAFEHLKDRDRFLASLPAAGKYELRACGPFEREIAGFDDVSGKEMFRLRAYGGDQRHEFEVKGPTRLRLEAIEWGENACGMEDGLLVVAPAGKALVAERLAVSIDRTDPTRAAFSRAEWKPHPMAVKAMLDADGDGRPDLELPAAGEAAFRYPAEGVYCAQALLTGADGTRAVVRTWVEATGHREKKGVRLLVSSPRPGETIETGEPIRASAISYSGASVSRVDASIDGRPAGAAYSPPYEIPVAWDALGPGEHALSVVATDARGERATVERKFRVSEFFDLLPRDGSLVTGQEVAVSWSGRTFGPASVRVRKAGELAWARTVRGQDGRARRVALADLEPGVAYEIQPAGEGDGPVLTATRVKGLAFGRTKYAASIRRDYDQKVGVSVRNHGEKPLTVRLECGKPPEESRLLAGFVGEGSEGAPLELKPGEERDFLLGVSAQDCVARRVPFPIRLAAVDGSVSDEASVDLEVKLPNVDLAWEEKGTLPDGLGKILLLRNKGDTLTDLSVRSPSPDLFVSPSIDHGMFPAGEILEFRATPRLYDGFRAVEAPVVAKALDKAAESPQKMALKEGERIHAVDLAARSSDPATAERQRVRALAGAFMNPASVDWSKKANPQDTDNDGKADRWTVDIRPESTRWIGLDTNGDGEIDMALSDVGFDGVVDFSAMKGAGGWEETNLVESWLEMGFSLPWARSAYEKHDADILVNDAVVGRLRDTIPEGNYAFKIPPTAFRFGDDGRPSANEVKIRSKHLRGGHYVVSSDFRMKMKLTGTRVYAAAKTAEEAKKAVLSTPGLVLGKPDLSISSQEMRVACEGEPKGGAPLAASATLRNLGTGGARLVDVALRFSSGGPDVELARVSVPEVPASGAVPIEIRAAAPAGDVTLKLVVDPEKRQDDADRTNHEARAPFKASGDSAKPAVKALSPAAGSKADDPVVVLKASASDDTGVARVDVRVDQGLWSRLARAADGFEGKALLQPGAHTITYRALDTSGNAAEQAVPLTVAAKGPAVEILEPAAGAKIDAREAKVVVACGEGTAAVAARANGGPWVRGAVARGRAEILLPLSFGGARLEAMAVDGRGVRTLASRPLECTRQPTAGEAAAGPGPRPAAPAPTLDVPGMGPVDPFGDENPVAAGPDTVPLRQAQGPEETRGAAPAAAPGNVPGADALIPDDPGPDGTYGSDPPEGAEPAALEGLDDEEASVEGPEGDAENLDGADWLDDPAVDRAEDPELADPEAPEDPDWQPPDVEDWEDMPVDDPAAAGAPGEEGEAGESAPLPPPSDSGFGGFDAGGGHVGVQQQQSDWYCTNRPEVGVPFRLPDWLMKLKLPKPGTKEFEEAFARQLEELKARGFDVSRLEKFRDILKKRCGRLESPDELPDFLQSLGFKKPNTQDPAALAEWRERMANAADAFMLRLLHSGDPALIAQGLRARMEALGKFDQASQESAQAVIETVMVNQREAEFWASFVPYLNIALSARGLYTGESLSGEKLGTFERALSALMVAGPAASLLRNPTLRSLAGKIGSKAMWLGENTIGRLAARLGVPVDRLKGALNAMREALGNARIKAGEKLFGRAWAAEQRFLASPAGRQAAELAKRDLLQAKSLLQRIASAQASGDKATYRKLIGLLQGNKTAQGLLNSGRFTNAFRAALDRTHRAMGRLADRRTIAEVMKNPRVQSQIAALARKFGVKAEDIVIKARNVSGNVKSLRTLSPGEMLKYGADRDVVYQFVTKQGRTLADVHHKIVEPVYARNLRQIAGRSLYEMDHVVTSRWHPEAYNAGLNPNTKAGQQAIQDIISGRSAGRLGRPTDIRDTIIHKGREWMDAGEKIAARGRPALGNQKVREGMRQMLKEYDRQVSQFLKAKGLDPSRALPPRLRQGLDIFRRVQQGAQDGSFTVEQAKEMLKALTPRGSPPVTPQTIADDLGGFVEFMNKWGLKTP